MSVTKMGHNPYDEVTRNTQDQLVVQYLPALRALAFRLKERLPASVDVFDLISVGTEELIKLARRYDPNLNDSFWGYAQRRVHGSMLDYLRTLDVVSRNSRKLIKQVEGAVASYFNEHEEEPSDEYLSKLLGEDIEKIKEARMASNIYATMPLDDQLAENKMGTLEAIEQEELLEMIQEVLETASKREQLVMQLYYFEELNFKEISEIMEISESRVSQLHKSVVLKIRNSLAKKGGLDG